MPVLRWLSGTARVASFALGAVRQRRHGGHLEVVFVSSPNGSQGVIAMLLMPTVGYDKF